MSAVCELDLAQEADCAAYQRFLLESAHAMLYHDPHYLRFAARLGGFSTRVFAVRDGERILAAVPLSFREGPAGTVINSSPFFGSHGGILSSDPDATALLNALLRTQYEEPSVASLTVIHSLWGHPAGDLPELPGLRFEDQRIGMVTHLPADGPDAGESLMEKFSSQARRDVRKAQRAGLSVAVENDALGELCRLHQQNMRDIGVKPKPDEFFSLLPEFFRAGESYQVYTARLGDELVAALLVFYFNDTIEYYTPATLKAHRNLEAPSLLIFQAMCDAVGRGCRHWNWGGTQPSQQGVYKFKKKWGTAELPYQYHIFVKHEAMLHHEPAFFQQHYDYFYVVPFSELRPG